MMTTEKRSVGDTITGQFLTAIRSHLADQDFGVEEGEVKFIDSDKSTICYGLFPVDGETGCLKLDPEVIWVVEVFADVNGGR